ncbi:MAG: type I-F CRISPR-associated helicase Cas3f, partial [Bdellovibrionales bacterium]|nr:type I-F CRISPR-associated helicase Cas3f [Bdellovibrionales bacterium]
AIKKTQRVLDAFANRVGRRTWRTVITMEGLSAVKKLLKKTASRNTAVACHWIRRRNHSEIVWIVGNQNKFNIQGEIPVNFTEQDIINTKWESDWKYLPLIKTLTAMSALFHDWGKTNTHFQNKLKNLQESDPIRHEWVSYMLLSAFIQISGNDTSDEKWLTLLAEGKVDKEKIKSFLESNEAVFNEKLPPAACLISWAVMTHHKLPTLQKEKAKDHRTEPLKSIDGFFSLISKEWGYKNKEEQHNLDFSKGLLEKSSYWIKELQKWASKTKTCLPLLQECLLSGGWPVILHHIRLSLMLGDHFFSSQDADPKWQGQSHLYANTKANKRSIEYKQKLDEHLIGVMKEAVCVSHLLPRMESQLPKLSLDRTHILKKKSPKRFRWQDKAVDVIKHWKENANIISGEKQYGFFGVNMASTGTGKTFANAKVMLALSENESNLRYTLALGLRTLTLQTGDEYRNRIRLDKSSMAVQIGSKAIMELHEQKIRSKGIEEFEENIKRGSESLEPLLEEEINYDDTEWEKTAFKIALKDEKQKGFFYSPVLVCTIDLIISATETKRGGRYILPCLRLMSSDLVIDEIDDFNQEDLIAIGRLIFLTGMLGRKVIISSATIPPALAEGYFNAYQKGWLLFCKTRFTSKTVGCAWVDEFGTQIKNISPPINGNVSTTEMYKIQHEQFIKKRVNKLKKLVPRRKGEIVRYETQKSSSNSTKREVDYDSNKEQYFECIKNTILTMHKRHKFRDEELQKSISIGLVRMANIDPCIALSQYLIQTDFPASIDIKIMTYHSRQIMLLRSEQEKYLDSILKKREESLKTPIISEHLKSTQAENVIFIAISTPVEEVGRDHDFDWAVVEPSSLRSIIQLAGRVRRHRENVVHSPNVALMQYNLMALKLMALKKGVSQPAYCRPGYESTEFKLETHDLTKLLNEKEIAERIDAVPRIQKKVIDWKQNLANLEHEVISNLLTNYDQKGPESLQGYIEQYWWLTALPQILVPFRNQQPHVSLYLVYDDNSFYFAEKDKYGKPVERDNIYKIKYGSNDDILSERLWLKRDYKKCLETWAEKINTGMKEVSLRYGELSLPTSTLYNNRDKIYLNQFGLTYSDNV